MICIIKNITADIKCVVKIYKSHPDRLRDWLNHPKANGYQALHVTLMSKQGRWIEVQIRSDRMDEVAEKIIQKENHVLSVDDLEQALELTDKNDIKHEQSMLKGIIRFGDETAKEVMTSRQNIVDLDIRSTYPEVLKCIEEK